MKKILPILFLTMLAQGTVLQQQPGDAGIQGTIARFGTGEILSKASVDLVAAGASSSSSISTTTESDGRFYFPNLPPGTYRLYARRDGYWPAEFGQRWVDGPGQAITLGAGQQLRDVQVVMTPGGVIAGRITGRDGLPLAGARVRAMKPWIQENQRQLRAVQEVVANDLGEYRLIWLMPGRFYISATFVDYSPAPQASQLVIDPDAAAGLATGSRSVSRPVTSRPLGNGLAEDEVYTPIYFPNTLESDKALAVELKQGEEYRGADITVSPVRAFHVRGIVSNLPQPNAAGQRGAPPAPFPGFGGGGGGRGGGPTFVRLTPTTPNGSLYGTNADAETGKFDFQKVITGSYVAYLFVDGLTVRTPVDVRNGDVDGVSLPITSGLDIPINLTLEGSAPPNVPAVTNLTVTLWRNPTLLNAPAMPATAGNPPVLRNIAPGNYHVYLNPVMTPLGGANPVNFPAVWQSVYVKSMRLGDVDVLNGGLSLERQPEAPLEVVVGANPGSLQGQVVNERREPVIGAVVTIFANAPEDRIYRTDMYKVTSTDMAGQFQLQNLRPGDYRVFAWENVERGTWIDSSFLKLYEERGVTIHIDEGQAQSASVPVVTMR
jgi:Carboxypeptidase regulatory-like domain